MKQSVILGIPFSAVIEEAAAEFLVKEARSGRSTFAVFTPNPLIVMRAQKDPDYARILQSADLSLADGTGIVSAARRADTPLPGRCTGIGTAEKAFSLLAKQNGTVYLLGGKAGVAAQAADALVHRFHGLRVAGFRDGFFTKEETAAVLRDIAAVGPDLLCVCLGAPKQERFILENRAALHVGCAMALGGSLDVWAGRVKRAPALFLRLRAEWVWRMLCEPKRLRNLPELVRFRFRTRRGKKTRKR